MSLVPVDFIGRAKSVAFVGIFIAASAGVIASSGCSRAESDSARAVQAETKRATPASKPTLPQRPKVKTAHEPKQSNPETAEDKGEPAGQLQPQLHASNAGITACFDSLARASSHVVDGPHRAYSFWDPKKLNTGTFRSIVAMNYGGNVSPRGAAVIVNSPMRDSTCDATTVQVVPTARPCSAIQSSLITKGKAVANLTGLALIQTDGEVSYLLLPTAGDGCAIVSMAVIRGN